MEPFSRSTFPKGGWEYYQPQTNWKAPTPVSSTFDQTVVLIIKMRQKNPAITAKFNLSTDPYTVGNELEMYTRLRLGLSQPPSFPKAMPRLAVPEAVAEGVAGIKKIASGAALLLEWEESGKPPVASELANKRASVCVQCPFNQPGNFSRWFTEPVSNMLLKKLERVNGLNLKTEHDDKLGICTACLCPLRLKVFCGLDLILSHARADVLKELHPSCWILSERNP